MDKHTVPMIEKMLTEAHTPASEMPADDMAIAEARTRSRGELLDELAQAINSTNTENASNTPDFILANFAAACLDAFAEASMAREAWYGKSLSIDGETSAHAALEARTPAPATDVDALLAEAEDEAPVAGSFRDLILDLATALRESRAREVAAKKKYQRLFEPWDEVNGWCEHNHQFSYRLDDEDNSDGCMQCERDAAIARAEKAEAERDAKDSTINMMTGQLNASRRFAADYGTERDQALRDLAAARAELGALKQSLEFEQRSHRKILDIILPNGSSNEDERLERVRDLISKEADLDAARAELGALGPVEWECYAAGFKLTAPTKSELMSLCGKDTPSFVRAIRVVKEAQ